MSYPHCDSEVLHAPSRCEYCDQHPDWQKERILKGINFTGENDPAKLPCPTEVRRTLRHIEAWPGNAPHQNNQVKSWRKCINCNTENPPSLIECDKCGSLTVEISCENPK